MKKLIACIVSIVVAVLVFRIFFIKVIPQGHVGIVYSVFGGVKKEPLTQGAKIIKPGTKITIYPVFTQQGSMTKDVTEKSPTNEQFQVSTNSTKAVYVDCEFSYNIKPENVTKLYNKFGGKSIKVIENETLKKKIPMLVSNVTSNIDALELQGGGNLAEINKRITEYCAKELEPFFITIESVNIKAEVDPASQSAIQKRMDLLQQEEQARITERIEATNNQIRINKANADKEVAMIRANSEAEISKVKAQAEANVIKINSEAQAKANKELANSLTNSLIDWKKQENVAKQIDKWNGTVPQVQGNSSLLLDLR